MEIMSSFWDEVLVFRCRPAFCDWVKSLRHPLGKSNSRVKWFICITLIVIPFVARKKPYYPGKRPQTVSGSGRIMHENVDDDDDDDNDDDDDDDDDEDQNVADDAV